MADQNVVQMRVCTKCNIPKPATNVEFYDITKGGGKLTARCRACLRAIGRSKIIPERNRAKVRAWRLANLDRARSKVAELHAKNRDKYRPAKIASDKRRRPAKRAYEARLWANDPAYRLGKLMAHRMRQTIKGKKAGRKWQELVGYEIEELIAHLERQFRDGMNWNNYGRVWHVDHILPVALFRDLPADEALHRCWAITNLRPLSGHENTKKGAKRTLLL